MRQVFGKNRQAMVYRWLWIDDECPELCVVRHLLIFIYLCAKTGQMNADSYLFPPWRELKEAAGRTRERDIKGHVSKSTFGAYFKRLIAQAIPTRAATLKTGLHMFRKTGYLFAIWGDGEWAAIKEDARHKNDEDAMKYAGDAYSTKHLGTIFQDDDNKVKKYEPSLCQNPDTARIDVRGSNACGLDMVSLANEYVESLEVPPMYSTDLKELLNHAIRAKDECHSSLLYNKISSEIPRQQAQKLADFRNRMQAEFRASNRELHMQIHQLQQQLQQHSQSDEPVRQPGSNKRRRSNDNASLPPEQEQHATTPPNKRRKKAVGSNDLPGRGDVAKCKTAKEKLLKIQTLNESIPETISELTGAAQGFVNGTIRPILRCLRNHHGGDEEAFCDYWESRGGLATKNFSTKKCCGYCGDAASGKITCHQAESQAE